MRGGVILIALALLLAYLGVSGRYKCFGVFFDCIINPSCPGCAGAKGSVDVDVRPGPGEPPTAYDPKTRKPVVYDEPPVYDATARLLPIEPFV